MNPDLRLKGDLDFDKLGSLPPLAAFFIGMSLCMCLLIFNNFNNNTNISYYIYI
jgi:hypothetical protein